MNKFEYHYREFYLNQMISEKTESKCNLINTNGEICGNGGKNVYCNMISN